jgi:NAD(P)H-hydrate epimerase
MENAGRSASQVILERFPDAGVRTEILVFTGKGNNAGDAFVVARRLMGLGRRVRVFCLDAESALGGATLENFKVLKALKARMLHLEHINVLEDFFGNHAGPFTVVDGILGTGLHGALDGLYAEVVETLNRMKFEQVVALDIPTGVNGDTGSAEGASLQAALTVSFGFPKLGHFLAPGAAKRGELVNVDISLPSFFRVQGEQFLLLPHAVSTWVMDRDRYGHKNSFGHVVLLGGSQGRVGALSMAARACHRMGTGLVTAGTWPESSLELTMKLPQETMSFQLPTAPEHMEQAIESLKSYHAMVIGPGMGVRPVLKSILETVISHFRGPLVLDADALNAVAEFSLFDHLKNRQAPTVLTPHPGEMARLLNIPKSEVVRDAVGAMKQAVARTHAIVVLKGPATLIASPNQPMYLSHHPNDGMATAGSGDVLAGMIGGLLGQSMDPFLATLTGVTLHSYAGGLAAEREGHRSMTAGDLIECIGASFKKIRTIAHPHLPVESRANL